MEEIKAVFILLVSLGLVPSTPAWPSGAFLQPHGEEASTTAPRRGLGPTAIPGPPSTNGLGCRCSDCCQPEKPRTQAPPPQTSQRYPMGVCEPSAAPAAPCQAARRSLPLLRGSNSHFMAFIA